MTSDEQAQHTEKPRTVRCQHPPGLRVARVDAGPFDADEHEHRRPASCRAPGRRGGRRSTPPAPEIQREQIDRLKPRGDEDEETIGMILATVAMVFSAAAP